MARSSTTRNSKAGIDRRGFLKATLAAAGAMAVGPRVLRSADRKPLRIAVIGVAGRCAAHYRWLGKEKVVALCDADTRWFNEPAEVYRQMNPNLKSAGATFPDAKRHTDYRELFDHPDDFDAVTICVPDHHHYPAAIRALRAGKAVFCEKPLTWSVWEARQLAAETARLRLPTQMGNQGMGGAGWRQAHAYYHAKAIGQVREVHAWIPLPGGRFGSPGIARPVGADPVPKTLDWDVWLGPAPERPYKEGVYHTKKWRYWADFGGGTLTDIGVHTFTTMFKILEPTWPAQVELVKSTQFNGDSYPKSRIVRWDFPAAAGRDAFSAYWHDGGLQPPRPKDLEEGRQLERSGCLFIGTEGTMLVTGSHNSSAMLIPESKRRAVGKPKMIAPASRGHFDEFVQAAKGLLPWDAPLSNFKFGGNMTGIIQLGNAALKASRHTLDIDPKTGRITNLPEGEDPTTRKPRPGWYV